MSTTTRTRRPQLADQIDRLDTLLDGLADGLNEAVADAAQEGVRAAVREILTGLLADPEALAALRPQPDPVPTRTPARHWFAARVCTGVARASTTAGRVARSAASAICAVTQPAGVALDVLRLTGGVRRTVVVAVAVGLITCGLTLVAPGWLAAVVAALSGAITAISVRLAIALRNVISRVA